VAALTHNLKKYLKFVGKKVSSKEIAMPIDVKSVVSIVSTYFGAFRYNLSLCFSLTKIAGKKPIVR